MPAFTKEESTTFLRLTLAVGLPPIILQAEHDMQHCLHFCKVCGNRTVGHVNKMLPLPIVGCS